jgi:sec-independent protein translocase protein TatA
MGSLGFPELLVIGVIALLLFGPKRLPDAGKALGQAIRGFKGAFEAKDEAREGPAAVVGGRDCPGCGKAVDAGAGFCQHCGRRLDSTSQQRSA